MLKTAVWRVASALIALVSVVLLGGVMLWVLGGERHTLFDTIYFALITVSTVGYAELPGQQESVASRTVTAILIVAGVGAVAVFQSTLTALLVEGVLGKIFRRSRMDRRIAQLTNHHVIAGVGRTGRYVAEEFTTIREPFVVIDHDVSVLERLNEELGGNLLYVVGNATEDHTLVEAGIERARGVIAALNSDPDNLFVTLSARNLNPRARIVSKVVEAENEKKLFTAGASATVSPNRIGGLRLASELVRPNVTQFLESMVRVTGNQLHFEEVEIPAHSKMCHRTLREVPIRSETRLLVVALQQDGEFHYNPSPDMPLLAGMRLIVMGEMDGVERLREMVAQGA